MSATPAPVPAPAQAPITAAETTKKAAPEFPMDPNAPLFVASAVVASAIFGGCLGVAIGIKRRQDPFPYATGMAINCGIAGLSFFGLREYLVSPILVGERGSPGYARRYDELTSAATVRAPTIKEVRRDRLLDTAIAGGATGTIYGLLTRRPRAAVPMGLGVAAFTTLTQFIINSVRVKRLQVLTKRAAAGAPELVTREFVPEPAASSEEAFDAPRREDETVGSSPLSQRILRILEKVSPVRQISDDEYLETLEKRRREIDKRLAEIQEEEELLFSRSQAMDQVKTLDS